MYSSKFKLFQIVRIFNFTCNYKFKICLSKALIRGYNEIFTVIPKNLLQKDQKECMFAFLEKKFRFYRLLSFPKYEFELNSGFLFYF